MNPLLSLDSSSTESDVFYVQRSSEEGSPIRNYTPAVLNSTKLSGAMARRQSPEPRIVTVDSDSNEPTFPSGFGSQRPNVPPSLNDLNLPHNPFNVLATMAVIRADEEYSPQSKEPCLPSPISTPPMNVSTIEGWDITQTTTDDATFYSSDEPRRVYWDISSSDTFDSSEPKNASSSSSLSSTPPSPRRKKRETEHGDVFSQKRGSDAEHLRGMRLALTSQKDTLMLWENSNVLNFYSEL